MTKRLDTSNEYDVSALMYYSNTHTIQIASLESELENVHHRAKQFEEEVAEESQGVDVKLMDSQVAEYNQLKAKAGKKTTTLTEQLRLVGFW